MSEIFSFRLKEKELIDYIDAKCKSEFKSQTEVIKEMIVRCYKLDSPK